MQTWSQSAFWERNAETLAVMWKRGDEITTIAAALGINRGAVAGKLSRLKLLKSPDRKQAATIWTTERDDALKSMRDAGRTMRDIAIELGVSRPAISGRLHRLGLTYSGHIGSRRAQPTKQPIFPKDIRPTKLDTTESLNMTLLELEPSQCRYPTSPDDATSHLFCGAPKAEGSYCAAHHALSYGRHPGGARPRRYFPKIVLLERMTPVPTVQEDTVLPHGKSYSMHSGTSS